MLQLRQNYLDFLRDEETLEPSNPQSNPKAPFITLPAVMEDERIRQKEALVVTFPTVMRYRIIDIALFKDGKAPLRTPTLCRELTDIKLPSFSKLVSNKVHLSFPDYINPLAH